MCDKTIIFTLFISCLNFVVKEVEEEEKENAENGENAAVIFSSCKPAVHDSVYTISVLHGSVQFGTHFFSAELHHLVSSSSVSSAAALREAIEAFGDILF